MGIVNRTPRMTPDPQMPRKGKENQMTALLASPVTPKLLPLADLKAHCTRRRPRGQNSDAAVRLRNAVQRRADRAFAIATKGQRLPRPVQAIEIRSLIESAIRSVEGRASARTIGVGAVIGAAREAASVGMAYRDGGKVTGSAYKYSWSTTAVNAHRTTDGMLRVDISRDCPAIGVTAPAKHWQSITGDSDVLAGSYVAVRDAKIGGWRRYDREGNFDGIAIRNPDDLAARYGRWEHGATVAECRAEQARKRQIVADERAKAEARRLDLEAQLRSAVRLARAARLLARISAAPVAAADVRAVGGCQSGIDAWAKSHGLDPAADTIPLRTLAIDETGARYALLIARQRYAARASA